MKNSQHLYPLGKQIIMALWLSLIVVRMENVKESVFNKRKINEKIDLLLCHGEEEEEEKLL